MNSLKKALVLLAVLTVSMTAWTFPFGESANLQPFTFVVTNSQSSAPIQGAHVTIAEFGDGNLDGFLSADEGTTDVAGEITLHLPTHVEDTLASISAVGTRGAALRIVNSDVDGVPISVTLEPTQSIQFWGRLQGDLNLVSGAVVRGIHDGPDQIRAISDSTGRFVLTVARDLPMELLLASPLIDPVSWDLDPTTPTSPAAPYLIPVVANTSHNVSVAVTNTPNGVVPEVFVRSALPRPGEPLDWRPVSVSGSPATGSFTGYQDEVYQLAVINGNSYEVVAHPVAGPATQVQVDCPGVAAGHDLSVRVSNPTHAASDHGTVVLHPSRATLSFETELPQLHAVPLSSSGTAIFSSVHPGYYDVVYFSPNGRVTEALAFEVTGVDDEVVLTQEVWEDALHAPASITGPCTLNGTITVQGTSLSWANVSIERPLQGVSHEIEVGPSGSFSIGPLQPGPVRLHVYGEDQAGNVLVTVGEPHSVYLSGTVALAAPIELHPPCIVQVIGLREDTVEDFSTPVPGIDVVLEDPNGNVILSTTAGSDGVAFFPGVSPGDYVARSPVAAPGSSFDFTVQADELFDFALLKIP